MKAFYFEIQFDENGEIQGTRYRTEGLKTHEIKQIIGEMEIIKSELIKHILNITPSIDLNKLPKQ